MDIIIPVYQPAVPEILYDCIRSVISNTADCNLIISSSDKNQIININRGLTRAKSKIIAILDWDVIVPPGWLDKLSESIDGVTGIIGPKMVGEYNGLNTNAPNGVAEWPTLAGGCLVFKNLGLRWDKRFPSGYWADTDFCRQFKEKGLRVAIDGDVVVKHTIESSRHNASVSGWQGVGHDIYVDKWGNDNF